MRQKKDSYSPNNILGTLLVTVFCIIVICGQNLWIPASRIENLYLRSIVLSISDAGSFASSSIGLDRNLPKIRSIFLTVSGLSGHTSWDTRYYNTRSDAETVASINTEPVTEIVNSVVPEANISIPESEPIAYPPIQISALSSMHSTEKPLKVFMFGDSQVFSLGSGLSRLAGSNSPVDIVFLAIHSSGFIRGDYYNWPVKLTDTFRESQYEAAIMMLGMNDYQSFWNNKGEIMKKCTPEWEAAYKDKCRKIIDITLASVPRLYWIGMPAVKNSVYESNLTYIDSVQESLAQEYSPDVVIRISLRDTIPGKNNSYIDSLTLENEKVLKVMNSDGSHFTVEGGQVVMKPLFDRLATDYLFTEVPVANLPN